MKRKFYFIIIILFVVLVVLLSEYDSSNDNRQFIFNEILGLKHHCASVTELEDGSLIAVWYYGNTYHGEGDRGGAILASVYNGWSWTSPFVVYDTPWKAEGNPVIFYDSYNKQLYLFTGVMHSEENEWDKLTTHMLVADVSCYEDINLDLYDTLIPIRWIVSEYKSEGWNKGESFYGIVLRNKPLIVDNQLMLAFNLHRKISERKTDTDIVDYTKRKASQTVGIMSMDLKTKKWSEITYIRGSESAAQPSLAKFKDEIIMFCRNTSDEYKYAWVSRFSKGWSDLEQSIIVNENNSLDLITLPNGALLMVRNSDRSRDELLLEYSEDGLNWKSIILEQQVDSEFSYPCMILSRDGKKVYIVYTYQRRTIAFRSFDVDNLVERFKSLNYKKKEKC